MASTNIPSFYNDPMYQKSQDFMFPYGTNILQGNIPSYYAGIGQSNSPEFQAMMASVNKNIMDASASSAAAGGIARSGVAPAAASGAIASTDAGLAYQDLLTANQGKQFLMGMGSNMVGQVGSNALTNQGQVNDYNLNAAGLQFTENKENQSLWSSILSGGIGALGNLFGMNMLTNAIKGLGSAGGGGGGSVGGVGGMGLDFTSGFGGMS